MLGEFTLQDGAVAVDASPPSSLRCQSYKHFTLVNYDSWVVIWGIFQSGTALES